MNKVLRQVVAKLRDEGEHASTLADAITEAAKEPINMRMKGGMYVIDGDLILGERSPDGEFEVPDTGERMQVFVTLRFGNQDLAETIAQSMAMAMALYGAAECQCPNCTAMRAAGQAPTASGTH